jgi:hypothetical protein
MKRIALGVGLTAIALFAFHYWSLWFLDGNPRFRAFVLSPSFAGIVFVGMLMAGFVCVAAVSALLLYPAAPAGRMDPEDHV